MSLQPRAAAFLKNEAATGWFDEVLVPTRRATSLSVMPAKVLVTAPEPMVSRSAATDEAWQRRVQWSTLLVPKTARMSFWKT
jgi:hypothetical protein